MNDKNVDLSPSQALLLDGMHQHRASCHGPIGELQCGMPGDPEFQVGQVKSPLSMFERISLMVTCYVVIFTCILLVLSIFQVWSFISDLSAAMESWSNQLNAN